MKKQLVFIVSIFLLFVGTTISAQEKINQYDRDGNRIGVWKKYFDNGNLRYKGQFEAGKEIGEFRFYSAIGNEHPIIIKNFNKENDSASVHYYTEEGLLESNGFMNGKQRVGTWIYYSDDGKTKLSDELFVDGVLHGKATTYYKTGEIAEVKNYREGKLDGEIKRYAFNGALTDHLHCKDGMLNGMAIFYDLKGNIIAKGVYLNDKKSGKWEYFEDGKLIDPEKLKQ